MTTLAWLCPLSWLRPLAWSPSCLWRRAVNFHGNRSSAVVPAAFILFLTASMSFNMVAACDRGDDIDGKVSEAFGPKPTTSKHASLVSVEGAIDDALQQRTKEINRFADRNGCYSTSAGSFKDKDTTNQQVVIATFHVGNVTHAQHNNLVCTLRSARLHHQKCRLVVLTDMQTDFTAITQEVGNVKVKRHAFKQTGKVWAMYNRVKAERLFLLEELRRRGSSHVVFVDSNDIVIAGDLTGAMFHEHAPGVAFTFRGRTGGSAAKSMPINLGVKAVHANALAEGALVYTKFLQIFRASLTNRTHSLFVTDQASVHAMISHSDNFRPSKFMRSRSFHYTLPIEYTRLGDMSGERRCVSVLLNMLSCRIFNAQPFDRKACRTSPLTKIYHLKGSLKSRMAEVCNTLVPDGASPLTTEL